MDETTIKYANLSDIPEAVWGNLVEKKIYFGHQSVGFNIVDGLKDIQNEIGKINLNIVEQHLAADMPKGVFAHARVGQNRYPEKKIDHFADALGNGTKADIAFMKLCYVDIDGQTNVGGLFDYYRSSIERLQRINPDSVFVHLTVPLKITQTTWKTRLKKLLGKSDLWEYQENINRNRYNDLLRSTYSGKQPVLDIAQIESTKPNGEREFFKIKKRAYETLHPAYTYDGGHLNEMGRKRVAEQLLILLANLD